MFMINQALSRAVLLLALISLMPDLVAQSDAELTARSAKNTVFAEINEENGDLRFISNRTDVDDIQWEYATKEEEPLLLIQDNTYNLRLRMTNPLKYRVTVEGKLYEEDNYDKTLRELAGNVQTLLGWVTKGANAFGTVGEAGLRPAAGEFQTGTAVKIRSSDIQLKRPDGSTSLAQAQPGADGIRDYEIRRAIMTLRQNMLNAYGVATNDLNLVIQVVGDSVKGIEANANADMLADASAIIDRLVEVDLSTTGADAAIAELESLVKTLFERNNRLAGSINSLALLTPDWIEEQLKAKRLQQLKKDKELTDLEGPDNSSKDAYQHFLLEIDTTDSIWIGDKAYSQMANDWQYAIWQGQQVEGLEFLELALQEFAENMTAFVNERKTLVSNLNDLLKIVQSTKLSVSRTEHGTDLLTGQFIPRGKVEKVTIGVKKRSFSLGGNMSVEVKESELFTCELKFMRAHLFYPQIFPALVFVNAEYPEFTTQEDSTGFLHVGQKANKLGYINVAGMVNFNVKMGRKTEVPFLQIGTSLKKARPQLFVGAGIRLSEWFGISAGAVMSWQGELDKLSEGDRVKNQDDIETDLKYSLSAPQLYFAIQLRPSSVTKKPQ